MVTTTIEHNAVARPLHAMAERGIEVTRVACSPDGSLDLDDLDRALRSAPVRLVAMCHASNVVGTIVPVREAAQRAHEHGALFLLDAAQTAGVLPIDVGEMELDLLAFPGHKALLGPTGTGGLYVAAGVRLSPMRQGGTGTHSEEERQPEELPEALEVGTVNTVGLAGLGAALRYLQQRGQHAIRAHGVPASWPGQRFKGSLCGTNHAGGAGPNARCSPSRTPLLRCGAVDDDVRRLHDGEDLVTDGELEIVDSLRSDEAHEAVGPCLDLDDSRNAVHLDSRHDSGKSIPRRLGCDRALCRRSTSFGTELHDIGDRHEPLTPRRALHPEPALGLPATERINGHAEHLGGLADADLRFRLIVVRAHSWS